MGKAKSAEMRNLSRDEDLQLIALVRRWPALYDPEHVSYMDSIKKVAIWAKIGATLDIDPKTCRSRWYNIRDNYRKSMIRNHKKMRQGHEVKVYKYTGELGFLRTYFNLRLDRDAGLESADGDASDAQGELADESLKRNSSQEYEPPSKYVKLELEAEEQSSEPEPLRHSEEPHPVDSFLACVGQTLKTLPPYFLSLAKAEIFATVHKYELRMYSPEGAGVSSSDPLLVPRERTD